MNREEMSIVMAQMHEGVEWNYIKSNSTKQRRRWLSIDLCNISGELYDRLHLNNKGAPTDQLLMLEYLEKK